MPVATLQAVLRAISRNGSAR